MTAPRVSKARALRNSGVTTRLASGYLLLIAVILLVSAIGIVNIALIRKTYDQVLDVRIPRLGELQGIQELLAGLNANAHAALLNTDPEQGKQVIASIESGRSQAGEKLQALQEALQAEGTPQAQELATQFGDDASGVLVGLVKFARAVRSERREQALATLQEGIKPKLQTLSAHIASYQQEQIRTLASVKQEVAVKEAAVLQQTVLLALAAVLIACGFAYGIVRSVVRPLREARAVAAHMARGNFSQVLRARRLDEVGQVSRAFNQIAEGLSALVQNIRSSASQVHRVAADIGGRTARLQGSAAEQTRMLNDVLTLIDGVQKVNEDNARYAQAAADMATAMADVAQRSMQSVDAAVQEMQTVHQSSQKITDIIGLIDGIAFQTNILALNAAVEAARAGESGRGFAVVASEVRSLAGRSTEASQDIKQLIHNSQISVHGGTERVQSIASIMASVSETVGALEQQVRQIAEASQRQNTHVLDMVTAIHALLGGNDNNVQIVEDLRQALYELRSTAEGLSDQVAAFKTSTPAPDALLQDAVGHATT